jgi:esterase/lipase
MIHQEYVRKVPCADTAVLFIHGIVGTPNHFTDLISLVELVPESWSVHNVLLDGHGGNADDFADTSMEKWKNQVHAAFDSLARTHRRVVIVAHSMGTLFALQLALEFP